MIELMQSLESGVHGEELRRFFHEDAEQIEYPSLVDPRVGRRGLDGMIAAGELGAGMLAFQRYDVSAGSRPKTPSSAKPSGTPSLPRTRDSCVKGSTGFTPTASSPSHSATRRSSAEEAYDCYEPFR